jgi:hypothetical protein
MSQIITPDLLGFVYSCALASWFIFRVFFGNRE